MDGGSCVQMSADGGRFCVQFSSVDGGGFCVQFSLINDFGGRRTEARGRVSSIFSSILSS